MTVPGIHFEIGMPQSNMVFLSLKEEVIFSAQEVAARLAKLGVKVGVVAQRRFRLVTHYWITDEDVDETIRAFRSALSGA
jgi:threonine aldolase